MDRLPPEPFRYTGAENLEALDGADNYNGFLARLVLEYGADAGDSLDFGAGTGRFASMARDKGVTPVCVEPDTSLGERLVAAGFEVASDITERPERSVDYIYSLNVLEHIEDDRRALANLYACLRPGGTLLLYVPAFPALFSEMDRLVGHFRRYRKADLAAKMEQAGFQLRRAEYADSLGFPATFLYRKLGRDDGYLNPRSVWIYDRLIFPFSRVLDRVVSRWFGKNLIVVAVRPD